MLQTELMNVQHKSKCCKWSSKFAKYQAIIVKHKLFSYKSVTFTVSKSTHMTKYEPEEHRDEIAQTEAEIRTLESDIVTFTAKLPYWGQYISEKILSGEILDDAVYDKAYELLLEDAGLIKNDKSREDISIICKQSAGAYKNDLKLVKISQVEGINALVPGQTIEFGENLTIVYGSNGSGKSGYIRLFNNVFITKGEKKILPNVHEDQPADKKAVFDFHSAGDYALQYPDDCTNPEFKQFSVFDEKAVHAHLNNKNQFEFRPAGLAYFADLAGAYTQIEERLTSDIQKRSQPLNLEAFFDGESEIKNIITQLSSKTKPEHFDRYRPFSQEDKDTRTKLEKEKASLMALKKDKEIQDLNQQKQLLATLKAGILKINRFFTTEQLKKAAERITDCIDKSKLAKSNNITQFQSYSLNSIGGKEWKEFINASDQFARLQHPEKGSYPLTGDPCLLCHQPLTDEASKLIAAYWTFIKSKAEQDSIDAQQALVTAQSAIEALDLSLLPESGIQHKWLTEKKPDELKRLQEDLAALEVLRKELIQRLKDKNPLLIAEKQADTAKIDEIDKDIDEKIKTLQEADVSKDIEALQQRITFINHKEKLNDHFTTVEKAIKDATWIANAQKGKTSINKRDITNKEKELSGVYFNQAYIDRFNDECAAMNGDFGISITHTGSAGTSYRQLNLKGKQPTDILSEGEQKVISLADFLSETILSGVNKGIIFDDPVTSLDEERKAQIAERLATESISRQVIIFTHDLVFVSQLIGICKDTGKAHVCHWIEQRDGKPGYISLKNSPSYEKEYKTAEKPRNYHNLAKKDTCEAAIREMYIQQGFTSLRTCYETLVVFGFFNGVVQRFVERISVDSLDKVNIDPDMKVELMDSFGQCCRYMEGHSHSDRYAYKKPKLEDLETEIKRFDELRIKIKDAGKNKG